MSKRPPMAICDECGEWRQVHQREPEILCKNCYMQKNPPNRTKNFCARCREYKPIVARGLCHSCYNYCRYHDCLDTFPRSS